jgi:serine/threonine protein kinase
MDGTLLGKGSHGSVRLCSNKSTGHLMACKTIDLKVDGKKNVTEQQQACMIRREVKMHQLCSDHPNVVRMLGLFEDNAAVHILMEYCDAGCLSELLRMLPQGVFSVKTAAVGMKELAEALCWIHGKNIVHRDIKPENILEPSSE